MRKRVVAAAAVLLVAGALTVPAPGAVAAKRGPEQRYLVLYKRGVSEAAAREAIRESGGRVVGENDAIGLATVTTSNRSFVQEVAGQETLVGAARNARIGRVSPMQRAPKEDIERLPRIRARTAGQEGGFSTAAGGPEPLAYRQWDMRMINATARGSYAVQRGTQRVLVGVMDTGIAGGHPDIRRNFSARLSRNFTRDIPLVDGACADDPDNSCKDPANVDENGHGTHVAGTIASPINDFGMAGVAPNVRLVNIRAGQDSGYFFLRPTVNAFTYAADTGIDVINMSFYIDPWLYNCRNNPADSPAAQQEQRTIIRATQRAVDYASARCHVDRIGG